MVRFVVTLSDEQKAALETLRVKRGLRSEAHVIRDLIDKAGEPPRLSVGDAEALAMMSGPRETTAALIKRGEQMMRDANHPLVPLMERSAFNPQPKTKR